MDFIFLYSLTLYSQGIHSNCSQLIFTPQSKLLLLLYGRNHPKDQEIVYNDLYQVLIPDEPKHIMESNFSASLFGRLGHLQSENAVLGEVNKNGKT